MVFSSLPGVSITLKVDGYFESTNVDTSTSATVADVKKAVSLDQAIPVTSMKFYFRGYEATNDQILSAIGIEDGSTIKMTVQSRFLEQVHPFELRDPITGLLPNDPIQCGDRYSYDKVAFGEWEENLQGQAMVSPMTGEFMKVGKINDTLKAKVSQYIQAVDAGTTLEEHLSLDCLGRIHNILGHFRDLVGDIPRRTRPRIVCLGNESIGKSAEMERLTFMPIFPRGEERCTRIVVEIRCHRGPKCNPVFRVIQGRGMGIESEEEEEAREKRCNIMTELVPLRKGAAKMQQEMSKIMTNIVQRYAGPDLPPEICADRYIVLDVTGPNMPEVTYVDFPGLASNDRELLVDMLQHEFEKFGDYSIYLYMTKASELTEDGPYALLQAFEGGRLLQRTVGVVTQMDLADRIPGQANRAQELVDLALRNEKRQARDRPFDCGTFLVINKDEESDPLSGYEPVYLRAAREKKLLAGFAWANGDGMDDVVGSDALIQHLHSMYFAQMEVTFLPQVIRHMQRRCAELKRDDRDLGLPAVVCAPPDDTLLTLLNTIINGVTSTLEDKLPAILLKFDADYIHPLEMDLGEVLSATRTIPKLEVDQNIRQVYQDILTCFADRKAIHRGFWLEELTNALLNDDSEVKLGRFVTLIEALETSIGDKLDAFYSMLEEHLGDAFDVDDVTDKFSCVIRADRTQSFEVPMVQLSFKIDADTLAHSICDSMRVFAEAIRDANYIREVLLPCSLVEGCRLERFDIWNEQRLLRVATTELLDLAYEFDSTGCVVCPGRSMSLYHVSTRAFLELSNGACSPYSCPQFVIDTHSEDLESRGGARFQVLDACNGDVAFWCPAKRQCLGVMGGSLGVYAIADPATTALPPEVLFRVEFQPPPEAFAAHASSAVSLRNVHSNLYVKLTGTQEGAVTVALFEGDASDFPLDSSAAFLVVDNPGDIVV